MFHFFKKHTKDGRERPDPTPIELNMTERPLTLAEQIARFTSAGDLQKALQARGMDTFDEADDFDVGQELEEKLSPYEEEFYGRERPLARVQTRQDEIKGGMTEEMPMDRFDRAKERFTKKKEKPSKSTTPMEEAPKA